MMHFAALMLDQTWLARNKKLWGDADIDMQRIGFNIQRQAHLLQQATNKRQAKTSNREDTWNPPPTRILQNQL